MVLGPCDRAWWSRDRGVTSAAETRLDRRNLGYGSGFGGYEVTSAAETRLDRRGHTPAIEVRRVRRSRQISYTAGITLRMMIAKIT